MQDIGPVHDEVDANMALTGEPAEQGVQDLIEDIESTVEFMAWRRPWEVVVSRSFVEDIKKRFPEIASGKDPHLQPAHDFNLVASILLAMRPGCRDQAVVLPYLAVGECIGYGDDVYGDYLRGDLATGRVLQRFIERILPGAKYVPSSYVLKRAQSIRNVYEALGEEIIEIKQAELATPLEEKKDPVFCEWEPTPRTNYQVYKRRDKRRESCREWADRYNRNGLQLKLLHYLNGLRRSHFKPTTKDVATAKHIIGTWDGKKRSVAEAQLSEILHDPKPRYRPSIRKNTPRVVTHGYSLATINTELRRALHPNWIELDLASAHLAIVAVDWGLKLTRDFLERGESIWDSLHLHLYKKGWKISRQKMKPFLKPALYAAVYNASWRTVIDQIIFHENISDVYMPFSRKKFEGALMYHPIMSEVLKARKTQGAQIMERGYAVDCFGEKIDVLESRPPRSVMSYLSQAREMKLLEPAINAAIEEEKREGKTQFWIPLWQHDGFSLKVSQKRDRQLHAERLIKAVNSSLGDYPTRLEVQFPDVTTPAEL